jgi:hypothetical protein
MTQQFIKNIFSSTYKDDFADSDGYYRMLFNSGRPLQARELTQMQTIIQSELARFGRNIFKEGAPVNPGGPTVSPYEFIKLDTSVYALPADINSIVDTVFEGAVSGVKARIIEAIGDEGLDPATIYVQYVDTQSGVSGTDPIRMNAGENMTNGSVTLTSQTTNTTENPAVGQGLRASNSDGDFFVQGHFVFAPAQSIILSKYSSVVASATIGFTIVQDIVTAQDDDALYDNQGAVPNLTSPGADRYRIRLVLTDSSLVDSDQNFIFYANIRDSQIVQQAKGTDQYNKINDLIATRTKEESGDYIVSPFKIKYNDDPADDTILTLDVSPGTAYVNGYRANVPVSTVLEVPKPTSSTVVNNEVVAAAYGNYVLFSTNAGLPDISTFELWNLRTAPSYGGSTIGTARVRAIEEDGANYRAYLFDIQMNAGQSFRLVQSIGTSGTEYINNILESGFASLKETASNSLLFALPNIRPQSITDVSMTVQRKFSQTTDGSGNVTITLSAPGETFANTNQWVATDDAGTIYANSATGAGTQSSTVSGGPNSTAVSVYAFVNKAAATQRTKTLQETTLADTVDSDGNGLLFVDLNETDIFEVSRITETDSDGSSLASRFTIDNGQRDNFYGKGRLVVRSGQTAPSGNVFIRFKYFDHGVTGDYFSVNSYTGQIDYADIPGIRTNTGETVNLRNVLDFRPVQDLSGAYSNSGTGARVNQLPQNTDLVTADVTYYNQRADKIVINEAAEISVITGEESLAAEFPATPTDALELYKVTMGVVKLT